MGERLREPQGLPADRALREGNQATRALGGGREPDHAAVQRVGDGASLVGGVRLLAEAQVAAELAQRHAVTRADGLDLLPRGDAVEMPVGLVRALEVPLIDARVADGVPASRADGDRCLEKDLFTVDREALASLFQLGAHGRVASRAVGVIAVRIHRCSSWSHTV